ncbi:hypothetical protein [Amycolatopsis sp. EV170708-02-1]|uniref:hypothetical protein n=1 Tax=Amycolatopsis sp. EV170708-02-1 TaxID=2919322 RepID=UPI001F0B7438|nr:hypothetical protein [Amycolatopsis sp. EV170708-02-1]UMP06902.1 hypothetical protein MJQ72_19745 [Amycolatopsis sp. EV170708-02-1]
MSDENELGNLSREGTAQLVVTSFSRCCGGGDHLAVWPLATRSSGCAGRSSGSTPTNMRSSAPSRAGTGRD